jgi:hypothetical protein
MERVTSPSRRGFRPLWSSAPPPIGWPLATCYLLLLAPAIAGTIFQWHWPTTAALLIPGIVLQVLLGYNTGRKLGVPHRTFVVPLGTRMPLGGVAGLAGAMASDIRPSYLAPLVFVLVLTVIVDPVWRIAWNRARTAPAL